jgi:peptide methionine sulfoxide reductase MsrA
VDGDVVGQLLGAAGEHDEHAVDAPTALDVQVAVDEIAGGRLDAHDPTELNRQGPDRGTQYRSTIFPANAEQEAEATTH